MSNVRVSNAPAIPAGNVCCIFFVSLSLQKEVYNFKKSSLTAENAEKNKNLI